MRTALPVVLVVLALGQVVGCRKEISNSSSSSTKEQADTPENALQKANEFVGRLQAAQAITDSSVRNSAKASVALDASVAGQHEVAKSALGEIHDSSLKNQTAASAALKLGQCKLVTEATTIANMISDSALKNSVLSKLAKGEFGN